MGRDIQYGAFCWNAEKEKENLRLHGLSFRDAVEVFADPLRVIARDDKHSLEEERLYCIGLVGNRIATVRFTYRGEIVRIFGAGFWRKGRMIYAKTRSS